MVGIGNRRNRMSGSRKETINLDKLFSKVRIGSMELKNRIALGEIASGGRDGYISEETVEFYIERARGGASLVMLGAVAVDRSGAIGKYNARVDDDKYVPGLAKLADLIHRASSGVKAGVQICHVGRQLNIFSPQAVPGVVPVAPSPVAYYGGKVIPHELTTEEVECLVEQFIEGARRVKEAGFDCVGLHGAHGYLISQFLSPFTNRRTDRYGGSVENRARFVCEVIRGIKQRCGRDFPVLIKVNVEDYVTAKEQITLEDAKAIAPFLEKAGVDEVHITCGQHESYIPAVGPYMIPKGVYADFASEIKKVLTIPVGVINRINDPVVAEQILEDGKADVIWMARALIADPEFPNKAAAGRVDEIRTCIACNTCIDDALQGWGQDYWHCAINPEAHREGAFHITPTLKRKKVLVIGGGPAGMEAARVAALMGHDVTLWEKGNRLGGQVTLACIPPGKEEFSALIRYFSTVLKRLGVKVELGKIATPVLVRETRPDAVIIATGSKPVIPPIPGVNGSNVVTGYDVLVDKVEVGERVAVIGGGQVGMEVAHFLAKQGKKITLVKRSPGLGKGMVRDVFNYIYAELVEHEVDMIIDTKIEEITDTGVIIVNKECGRQVIEADTVVLATGAKADRRLYEAVEGVVPEIYLAGDCLYPGTIRSAIYQGASVARMLD